MEDKLPDIKIGVATHKQFDLPANNLFLPIHVGRAIANTSSKDGFLKDEEKSWLADNTCGDDTGDNISYKNRSYCEMTALYWLWKNHTADYFGLFHYRRYMAFADNIKESFCKEERNNGCLSTNYLNDSNLQYYGIDESSIRTGIAGYDAIFVKPISLQQAGINSNYKAMEDCPDYHIMKDVDNMIRVIKEKYPKMANVVDEYFFKHEYNYLYNCFVMKSNVFDQFCSWLFDILFEMEKYVDTTYYSVKQFRVFGLLAERLVGIWALWMYSQNIFKIKEVPLLFVEYPEGVQPLRPAFEVNNIAIVSNFNNNYAPVFDVFLKSALDNISVENNYDFIVLSKDICTNYKNKLIKTCSAYSNVSIRFYNPRAVFDDIDFIPLPEVYSPDLYYRIVIPNLLEHYNKVLVVDADMICREDLAVLYNSDVADVLAAGVRDTVFQGQVNGIEQGRYQYVKNYMKMDNPYDYINTGVLLFNCEKYRERYSLDYLKTFIKQHIDKVIVFEQDMLNMLLRGNIKFLDQRWNIYTKTNNWVVDMLNGAPRGFKAYYDEAVKSSCGILHFANSPKPWQEPASDFADSWWAYARNSCFYEYFLKNLTSVNNFNGQAIIDLILDIKNWRKNILYYWKYKALKNILLGNSRTRYVNKARLYKSKIRNAKPYVKL